MSVTNSSRFRAHRKAREKAQSDMVIVSDGANVKAGFRVDKTVPNSEIERKLRREIREEAKCERLNWRPKSKPDAARQRK